MVLVVALGEEWRLLNHTSSVMNVKGQTKVGKHWSTQETQQVPPHKLLKAEET